MPRPLPAFLWLLLVLPHGRPTGAAVAPVQPQPNPPQWPPGVTVFGPGDPTIEQTVNAAYRRNGGHDPPCNGQFSDERYAFLFKPGVYPVDVPVGYYTQVLGLGESPDDVVFTGPKGVHAEEGDYAFTVGALNNFWRSAENFQTTSAYPWFPGFNGMLWAVSQASPLRRVHVQSNLILFQYTYGDAAGFASGGYLGNSQVDGKVVSGSQQQWVTRNCRLGAWDGAVWNMVFVGSTGTPTAHCGNVDGRPYVVEPATPVVAEKPFLTIDSAGRYYLNVPGPKYESIGVDWSSASRGRRIPFEEVYVADPRRDTAASLNARLAAGLHLVFAPGVYGLDAPLDVVQDDQVLLGLGLATLVSLNGNAVVRVGKASGVRIAGLLLEAGPKPTAVLLQFGPAGEAEDGSSAAATGDPANPGVISDVYARVGGARPGQVDTMVRVTSGNVVLDNVWLWRADHDAQGLVFNRSNPCTTGLVVDGHNVTAYGLAVEHTLGDLVRWNGDHGRTYFFQAEMPYDVRQEDYGDHDFVGYRVGDAVTAHEAHGAGVYHFFRDHPVAVRRGIAAPASPGVRFVSPLAVYLSGFGILHHVVNEDGSETSAKSPTTDPGAHIAWLC
eukprot:EG_transcript_4493